MRKILCQSKCLLILLLLTLILVGCGDDPLTQPDDITKEHECLFSDDWENNTTYHWHQCECGERKDREKHEFDSGVVKKEATETREGVILYTCLDCGYEEEDSIPKLKHTCSYEEDDWYFDNYEHWHECACGEVYDAENHQYNSGTILEKATCKKEGLIKKTCLVCGKTKTETVEKLAHSYVDEFIYDDNFHWQECACGATINEEEHDWKLKNETLATCTTQGVKVYKCSVCDKQKSLNIEMLAHEYSNLWLYDENNHWHKCNNCIAIDKKVSHTFGDWIEVKAPTSTSEGSKERSCLCGYKETEAIPMISHTHTFETTYSYNETQHWLNSTCGCEDVVSKLGDHRWNIAGAVETKAPTCTEKGELTIKCLVCDATYTEEIDVIPHEFDDEWLHNQNEHWNKCKNCDAIDLDSVTSHLWNSGNIINNSTCTKEGLKIFTCTICGENREEIISKIAHTPLSTWESDSSNHWHECSICSEPSNVALHNWNNGVVVKPATESSTGLMKYTCTTCGYTKEEIIPMLEHTHIYGKDWVNDGEYHWHECSICGQPDKLIAHTFSSSKQIVAPTTKHEGVKESYCTGCGETVYSTVAKLTEGREGRVLSSANYNVLNKTLEATFNSAPSGYVSTSGNNFVMKSKGYNINFVYSSGSYTVNFVDSSSNTTRFKLSTPVVLIVRPRVSTSTRYAVAYSNVEITTYGIIATATITSAKGSVYEVIDRYYYPDNANVDNAVNVERSVIVKTDKGDYGYQSLFIVETIDSTTSDLEWFVPNCLFGNWLIEATNVSYYETKLGLPMAMVKDGNYAISLSRYQPIINIADNFVASVDVYKGTTSSGTKCSSIEIAYPASGKSVENSKAPQLVYDMSLMMFNTSSFDTAMVEAYTNQYELENVRIVDTKIDEVYKVINKDFNTFLGNYNGLPWTVTIEDGWYGDRSYQAGFVGQQIPAAYNMMLYGAKYGVTDSWNDGVRVIDWWINNGMQTSCGLPKIWRTENGWSDYPIFTRMAIDAMEGMLDAYRLAKVRGVDKSSWRNMIIACANFYVSHQNSDGSWYRCYNSNGGVQEHYYNSGSSVDLAQGYSKDNTTMPVRFLGKIYELTGDAKYLNAIKKAGTYIYNNLYPKHSYYGGTSDNPNAMDKEAGVFAMYAYDTLYTLTGEAKWLEALKQATVFTMSSVITVSYKLVDGISNLKAAKPLEYGYTDGLSYITCNGRSVDNFAAFIYYALFRLYIYSGETVYYDMAEFIQQNTKSTMDWDGTLGFAYKSLTPEASTVWSGTSYDSAIDTRGEMGVWLPWQSVANAEPIAKMYDTFGSADVLTYKNTSLSSLRATLAAYGVGGKTHRKY